MENLKYTPEEAIFCVSQEQKNETEQTNLENLKEAKKDIDQKIAELIRESEKINKQMYEFLDQNIDIQKIPVLSNNSTDHKFALPTGSYYYISKENLSKDIKRLTSSNSSGTNLQLNDGREIDLPEDAVLISEWEQYSGDEESYYGTGKPYGGKSELYDFLINNPEFVTKYQREENIDLLHLPQDIEQSKQYFEEKYQNYL